MRHRHLLLSTVTIALAAGSLRCDKLIGLDKFHDAICTAGAKEPCYDADDNTKGKGVCKGGVHTCAADGLSWGDCVGQVLPAAQEDCGNQLDDDCNGMVNDGCSCVSGATESCYSGPAGTMDKGVCKAGTQTCAADGSGWGACAGEVKPGVESCATTEDDDCDGFDCVTLATGFDGGVNAIVATSDGGVIVTGVVTTGPATLGKGMVTTTGPFTAKLAADGSLVWQQPVGGLVVAVDNAGNVFEAGNAQMDMMIGTSPIPVSQYVLKLDPGGNVLWARSIAGASGNGALSNYGHPTSIVASQDGDVIVAGVFASTSIDLGDGSIPLVGGSPTAYVAKLNGQDGSGSKASTGSQWAQTFPAAKYGYTWIGPFVGVSAIGRISVLANSPVATIAGAPVGPGIAHVTFDALGNVSGAATVGPGGTLLSGAIAPDGTVLLAGAFLGTFDPKPSGGGTPLVAMSSEPAPPALPDPTVLYGDGFFVAIDGATSSVRFALGFGTAGHGTGLTVEEDGGLLATGTFSGVAHVGANSLDAGQAEALLLVKFGTDGTVAWARSYTHPADKALQPRLVGAADGTSWLAGQAISWPFNLGTGPLNTQSSPHAGFVAHFAP